MLSIKLKFYFVTRLSLLLMTVSWLHIYQMMLYSISAELNLCKPTVILYTTYSYNIQFVILY